MYLLQALVYPVTNEDAVPLTDVCSCDVTFAGRHGDVLHRVSAGKNPDLG